MSFTRFISSKTALSGDAGLTRWIIRLGILTAAVTMTIMILASSVINGFQKEIEQKIFGFWGHVSISHASMTSQYESVPMRDVNQLRDQILELESVALEDRHGEMIESNGGVRHVQSTALLPGIITHKGELDGVILKGITTDFDPSFFKNYLKKGSAPALDSIASKEAVISEQTASRLGIEIGDNLELLFVIKNKQFPRRFVVSGIYRTGLEEYDKKFVLVDIKRIRQLLKWDDNSVGNLEVFVEDVADSPLYADYIYYELLEDSQYAESIKDKYPGIFEWLELQGINEWVILGLMLLVCILNMMTTLLILILERTRMIGILKSLGSTNWDIRKIFIQHGVRILTKGLMWGNIIGIGLALIQKYGQVVPMNEEDYYLSTVPIDLNLWFVLALNLGTILLVMVCLWLPSVLVSRIDPVKAIRFS